MFEQLHAYCRQCAVNVAVHLLRWGASGDGARARLLSIKCKSASELVQLLLISHRIREEWNRHKGAYSPDRNGASLPRSEGWSL